MALRADAVRNRARVLEIAQRVFATEGIAVPSPGPAFFAVLDRMVAGGLHKKDLVDALAGSGVDLKSAAQESSVRLRKALGTLLRRAQADRAVCTGVDVEDVLALVAATYAAASRTGGSPTRLFAVIRDGLKAV